MRQHIKNQRPLSTKVHIVKAMVFPAVMYRCEGWTKGWQLMNYTFEFWCWRRLLRVPWTTRKSNQSILKGINHDYSVDGLMLKLKLQYFEHLTQRADSLEKNLDAGKDWRQKDWRQKEVELVRQHHWLNGHEFEQTVGDSEEQGGLVCCRPRSSKESDTM